MRVGAGEWLGAVKSRFKQFRRQITYSDVFVDFIASLATFVINLYTKTLNIRFYFHPEFLKIDRNEAIFGFWHGRQLLLIPSFGHWHVVLMTDVSWAGEIQTKILEKFGYIVVRGSSKRKGVQALLNMKKAMERGFPSAFALDGPRGPIHTSKPGIIFLAKKLKYPIVPTSTTADRYWILKNTWCQYLIPKPFSRCYVAMGRPLWASKPGEGLTPEVLDRILSEWTEKADKRVGRIFGKTPKA